MSSHDVFNSLTQAHAHTHWCCVCCCRHTDRPDRRPFRSNSNVRMCRSDGGCCRWSSLKPAVMLSSFGIFVASAFSPSLFLVFFSVTSLGSFFFVAALSSVCLRSQCCRPRYVRDGSREDRLLADTVSARSPSAHHAVMFVLVARCQNSLIATLAPLIPVCHAAPHHPLGIIIVPRSRMIDRRESVED